MQVGQFSVTGISDGAFVARPYYFGEAASPGARPDFFNRLGAAWLPIGCFLIRGGDRLILVDAGMGPEIQHLPDGMMLVGGQLLTGLYALGVEPEDIDTVVCTHLHYDHVGWLFTLESKPTFPSATIWLGAKDLEAVADGTLTNSDHIRRGLANYANTPLIHQMTERVEIAPGIIAHPSPGHTLGHFLLTVESADDQLLVVGDAITTPIQLEEPGWHSYGDMDVELGFATRDWMWNTLRHEPSSAVGCHFPGLRPIRHFRSAGGL